MAEKAPDQGRNNEREKRKVGFTRSDKAWFDRGDPRIERLEIKRIEIERIEKWKKVANAITAITAICSAAAIFALPKQEKILSQLSLTTQQLQAAPRVPAASRVPKAQISPEPSPAAPHLQTPETVQAAVCSLKRTGAQKFKAACDMPAQFDEVKVTVRRCGNFVRRQAGWCDVELRFTGAGDPVTVARRINPVKKIGVPMQLENIALSSN